MKCLIYYNFLLNVKAVTEIKYSYLGVVQLFHLLKKGIQVLLIIW